MLKLFIAGKYKLIVAWLLLVGKYQSEVLTLLLSVLLFCFGSPNKNKSALEELNCLFGFIFN